MKLPSSSTQLSSTVTTTGCLAKYSQSTRNDIAISYIDSKIAICFASSPTRGNLANTEHTRLSKRSLKYPPEDPSTRFGRRMKQPHLRATPVRA